MKIHQFLLIDNEAASIDTIRNALSSFDMRLEVIENGKKGLQVVKSNPPDLIMLAPEVAEYGRGYKFFTKIKKNSSLSHIPIILLPSKAVERNFDERGNYRKRAQGRLFKPVDGEELIDLINTLLEIPSKAAQRIDDQESKESKEKRGGKDRTSMKSKRGKKGRGKEKTSVKDGHEPVHEGDIISEEILIGEPEIESIELGESDLELVEETPSTKPFADLLLEAESAMDRKERKSGPITVEAALGLSAEAVEEIEAIDKEDAVKTPDSLEELLNLIERGERQFEARLILEMVHLEDSSFQEELELKAQKHKELLERIGELEQALEIREKENSDYQRKLQELVDKHSLELDELRKLENELRESCRKEVNKAIDILSSILPDVG